jgi:diaminopropionate ammonia-lyase
MPDFYFHTPSNQLPDNLTHHILSQSRAMDYHKTLENYSPTPLVKLPALAKKLGVNNIYLKDESHRFGLNAFKGLGASFAVHKALEENPEIGTVCTATDGNHGRAVAWAARMAGKKAVIYVPKDTTQNRIKAITGEGAEVIQLDENYDQTSRHAEEESRRNGWQLIQDAAWEGYEEIPAYIMAGYLTHFKELEDELHPLPKPKIDVVFLQAGVGSWAAAAIWYYLNRYGKNRPKLVLVEPKESDGILQSFIAGKRTLPSGNQVTIMAGLNCGIPSLSAWEFIKSGADAVMRVEDTYAEKAIRQLYYPEGEDESVIAGESGVGGLAGFLALQEPRFDELRRNLGIRPHSNVLFYSTEGATDQDSFNRIISR